MTDIPDNSRATDRASRGTGNVPLDRRTGSKTTGLKQTGKEPLPRAKTSQKGAPKANKRLEKIVADFLKRTENKADTGLKPGLVKRMAIDGLWQHLILSADLMLRLLGKDYELSREMLRHYLVGNGQPMLYEPPAAVQKAIREKFPRPGSFREVSGYGKWATPDIRHGLGHFDLDVVTGTEGELIYIVTDRYKFPDKVDGKTVEHGFQIGKPSQSTVDTMNLLLSKMEFARASGTKEKFELRKYPASGEYTIIIPQSLLVNNGVDFESMGLFTVKSEPR